MTTSIIVVGFLALVIGAVIGVLLGRRSARANEYTDEILRRLKDAEAKLKSYRK